MTNYYATTILAEARMADLRHEADQERLAQLARGSRPRQQRWWERLMLFRNHTAVESRAWVESSPAEQPEPGAMASSLSTAPRSAAAVALSDSPC